MMNLVTKKKMQKLPGRILTEDDRIVTLVMAVDDWIAVPGHPRQRDTVRHSRATHWREARYAEGALRTHLSHVTGAILNGELIKVDGHTRAYLWQQNKLERPEKVVVTAYKVHDEQELLDLYRVIDVSSAADSKADRIVGAFREHGYSPRSPIFLRGHLVNALHIALRGVPIGRRSKKLREFDPYKAVSLFMPELVVLDRINPPAYLSQAGILGAALIMLALHPESEYFFQNLFKKKGEKRDGKMDPVEATLDVIQEYKSTKYRRPPLAQVDICGRCIRAVVYWLSGPEHESYWLKNKIQFMELEPFLGELRKKKKIGNDPKL